LAARLRLIIALRLNALSFALILLFSLFGQSQFTLKLFDTAAFWSFLGYSSCAAATDTARLTGLILAKELAIETGIVGAPSTLTLLLETLFGCFFFCNAALLLLLPLTLFLVPTLLLIFHLLALLLP
jgi:hypothetical protein